MKLTDRRLQLLQVLDRIDGSIPMGWLIRELRPVAWRAVQHGLVKVTGGEVVITKKGRRILITCGLHQ